MKHLIDNRIENILPASGVYAGYLFIAIGLFATIANIFIGIVILIFSSLLSFTFNGVQIDIQNRRVKDYTKCLGIVLGRWQSLEIYTDVAVLRTTQTSKTYSRANASFTDDEEYFDVFLLNETHRIIFLVKRCPEQNRAIEEAQLLADTLGIKYSTYSPVISEKTRSRR